MELEKRLIELTLPESDIDGLYFNEQKIHAIFDKQDDGWWQAEEILFLSARNVEDDNSRDILKEYLNDFQIRAQIAATFNVPAEAIAVALLRENQGIKKYHGVDDWYWLAGAISSPATQFRGVDDYGYAYGNFASSVLGCSPAFRINEETV
jgi:hypothetical protein